MKWIFLLLCLLLVPLGAHAQSAGLVQYDATGQPLTPYAPMSYFGWLPRGAILPTEQVCASEISYTAPTDVTQALSDYTRFIDPNNAPMNANSSVVGSAALSNFLANPNGNSGVILPVNAYNRITGGYPNLIQSSTPPTTDMIIRWAACKYGIDEDTLRAQFWDESTWNGGAAGGNQSVQANCTGTPTAVSPSIYNVNITLLNGRQVQAVDNTPNGTGIGGCFNTWGIGQEKITGQILAYPLVRDSTSFAIDMRAAMTRGCIEGLQVSWFQGPPDHCTATTAGHQNCNVSTGNDLFQGCVASHFSGAWWDTGAQAYWNNLNTFIGTKPWPGGR